MTKSNQIMLCSLPRIEMRGIHKFFAVSEHNIDFHGLSLSSSSTSRVASVYSCNKATNSYNYTRRRTRTASRVRNVAPRCHMECHCVGINTMFFLQPLALKRVCLSNSELLLLSWHCCHWRQSHRVSCL